MNAGDTFSPESPTEKIPDIWILPLLQKCICLSSKKQQNWSVIVVIILISSDPAKIVTQRHFLSNFVSRKMSAFYSIDQIIIWTFSGFVSPSNFSFVIEKHSENVLKLGRFHFAFKMVLW